LTRILQPGFVLQFGNSKRRATFFSQAPIPTKIRVFVLGGFDGGVNFKRNSVTIPKFPRRVAQKRSGFLFTSASNSSPFAATISAEIKLAQVSQNFREESL
jgi:hypothetical protein